MLGQLIRARKRQKYNMSCDDLVIYYIYYIEKINVELCKSVLRQAHYKLFNFNFFYFYYIEKHIKYKLSYKHLCTVR